MTETDESAPGSRRRRYLGIAIVVFTLVALVGGLSWLVLWAQNRDRPATTAVEGLERYRTAWESAMRKAGVEATFPAEPVRLTDLRAIGATPFSATFTPDEIDALLAVYPFDFDSGAGVVSVKRAAVGFPAAGRAQIEGSLVIEGTTYSARAEADTSFADGGITVDTQGASLNVEGFTIEGERRDQAMRTVDAYFDALLRAAPGLIVEGAEIEEGGVRVEGSAPARLENP